MRLEILWRQALEHADLWRRWHEVFASGTDNGLGHGWPMKRVGPWGDSTSEGGPILREIDIASNKDGRAQAFALGQAGELMTSWVIGWAPVLARALAMLLVWGVAGALVACGGAQRVGGFNRAVDYGGLWFADEACAKQFAAPRVIRGAEVDSLAKCVAALDLQPSKRQHPMIDGAVLTYGGGLEVKVRYIDPEHQRLVIAIGLVGGRRTTIAPAALETLRVAGTLEPALDAAGVELVEATIVPPAKYAFVRLRVCLDDTGAVTSIVPIESSTPELIGVLDTGTDAWRFRPFVWNGAPRSICAVVDRSYPSGSDRATWVPHTVEELAHPAVPISGRIPRERRYPKLSDRERDQFGLDRTGAAVVRYCVDQAGLVFSSKLVEPSGFPPFDRAALRTVASWVFPPFLVRGQPIRVCSHASFALRTRSGPVYRGRTRRRP